MTTHIKRVPVRTLRAAHELLHREWPGHNPPASLVLAYHQRAAELYEQIANTDQDHHHEALYWARQESEAAQALAKEIATSAQDELPDSR